MADALNKLILKLIERTQLVVELCDCGIGARIFERAGDRRRQREQNLQHCRRAATPLLRRATAIERRPPPPAGPDPPARPAGSYALAAAPHSHRTQPAAPRHA